MAETTAWNPWRALRAQAHVTFDLHELGDVGGGALVVQHGQRAVVVISPHLPRRERWAALAHELVHLERGLLAPGSSAATVAREEARVRAEVARRLVPPKALATFIAARSTVEPITVAMVADEFDVPETVAAEALRQHSP